MSTYTYPFTVTGQHIVAGKNTASIGDTRGYVKAHFTCNDTWQGLTRLGVFVGTRGGTDIGTAYTVELDESGTCFIPSEALSSAYRTLQVGLIGYGEGDFRLTTDTCLIHTHPSCFRDQKTPAPPAPDLYAAMMEAAAASRISAVEAADVARRVEENAAAGAYNGADGLTPYIGDNENWWLGDTDTGVRAHGRDGDMGFVTFAVNPATGRLIMTAPDTYNGPVFNINHGYLEVSIHG